MLFSTFKAILDRYTSTIEYKISEPKEIVRATLSNAVRVSGSIRNVVVSENCVKIIVKPTFFDPSAGRGFIKMKLIISEDVNSSLVSCTIVPKSYTPASLFALLIFLICWTVAGLLWSSTFYSFLTMIFGWIGFGLIVHFSQVLNKGKLENFVAYIFTSTKLLNKQRSPKIAPG